MAAVDDVTHSNDPNHAASEFRQDYFRLAFGVDSHVTPADRRQPRRDKLRASLARSRKVLPVLNGLGMAVVLMATVWWAGFAAGQGHVLDLLCQTAGQSYAAAFKTCVGQ